MAMLQITIIPSPPMDNSSSVSEYVAEALKVVESSGLKYKLTPTATIIEGDLDSLFSIAKKIHEAPFKLSAKRVVTVIMIDDRRDKQINMEYKLNSVIKKLK